ncbi:MAG: hypothetical protein ACYCSO_05100 [Cuniculiplasma sp.]
MISEIKRNRINGKKYEGEAVKILKESGLGVRLGRSNEEGDVILPNHNIIIEVKSTKKNAFSFNLNTQTKDQYYRLTKSMSKVFYWIRFKGEGRNGIRVFHIPNNISILYKEEGLTLNEFLFLLGGVETISKKELGQVTPTIFQEENEE